MKNVMGEQIPVARQAEGNISKQSIQGTFSEILDEIAKLPGESALKDTSVLLETS